MPDVNWLPQVPPSPAGERKTVPARATSTNKSLSRQGQPQRTWGAVSGSRCGTETQVRPWRSKGKWQICSRPKGKNADASPSFGLKIVTLELAVAAGLLTQRVAFIVSSAAKRCRCFPPPACPAAASAASMSHTLRVGGQRHSVCFVAAPQKRRQQLTPLNHAISALQLYSTVRPSC